VLDTIDNFDSRFPAGVIREDVNITERYAFYLSQSRAREQIDRSFGLSNDVRFLGEITVTAEREALPPPQRRSLIVEPDRIIKSEDVGGYASNPLEMLRGRSAAFRVTGAGRDMTVTFNRGISWGGNPVPLFILDGMEVDLMTLVSIPASNVESIELLTDVGSLAIYGSRGSNGVIAVNTRPGGAVFAAREGIINRAFAGYYVPREFYAPDYSEQHPIHEKPDSRSTIWWEPNIALSDNGRGMVQFWTSDDTGPRFQNRSTRYRVHVEGLTSNGKPIVGWSYITVQ
jgi:TonB-dependent SusC/RagA subfamily outer membrane receptor